MSWQHPTGGNPKIVDLISLGPSQREYHTHHHALYDPELSPADEVWTLNKGIRTLKSDLAFVLDDLEGERRKSARYAQEIIDYARERPVITSEVQDCERDRWPGMIFDFPLTDCVDFFGQRLAWLRGMPNATPAQCREIGKQSGLYLQNSVPMILFYALMIGVQELRLFGADYTIRGSDKMEENRPNCEFWVGVLIASGIRIILPSSTTLLNTDIPRRIYGYARFPILRAVEEANVSPCSD